MCGRFTLSAPSEEIADIFGVDVAELPPRYNIAPTQRVAVVRVDPASGDRELVELVWGLVPAWAKDPAIGNKLINARGETVHEKASFKRAFERRRCLVVADGFFEWRKTEQGKQPFHITLKDGTPFAFAGLWERWTRAGPPIESCTIVTTAANDLLGPIHRRMPVILHACDWAAWLDPANRDVEALAGLLTAFPSGSMTARAVGKAVNDARHEGADCVAPVPSGDLFL